MGPLAAARVLAAGRVAIGLGLVLAPERVMTGWVGADAAAQPGTQVAARALGARDVILGVITLHVAGHPQIGPRWLLMSAAADAVDCAATITAGRSLPPLGRYGVAALAGGATLAGVALAARLGAEPDAA